MRYFYFTIYTYGSNSISYTYDKNGNITSIQTKDGTVRYQYDELYRLVREDNPILNQSIQYVYDLDGNITQKKIYSYQTGASLSGTPGDTVTYGYDTDWKQLMVSYDGHTITYDNIGNPLQYRGMNLTWANGKELYSVTKNGKTTTYRYNKDGMRNRKYMGDGTVIYQIQGSLISGEQKIGQDEQSLVYELEYYYDSDGNIISMLYNGTEYYYLKNVQGDIIGILDGSGASVVEYTYDSWGKLLTISGNQELGKRNPFRYRGYYYDDETGLYYVGSRYYDPETCRFINADDTEVLTGEHENFTQNNLYAYCFNNPVNMADDNGDWPSWATNLVIGTAVIATAAVLTVATAGTGTALACFAVGALKGSVAGALVGAGSGAATSAVIHRIQSGSWKGTGKAVLNGASSGYMSGAVSGFVTGGLTSKVCFVAGTAISSSVGWINIEDICVGDQVWAANQETGEIDLKHVTRTFVNKTNELISVYVNGETIKTTPGHPFYVPSKGWTEAINLRAGDVLLLQTGNYVIIELTQHEILENPINVYNFEVEDFHTYFVGENSILVHNVCKGRGGKQARLRELANDDKLSSALRGEIKRDINLMKKGRIKNIRVPSGYEMAHRLGYPARKGYSYKYSVLNMKSIHRLQHRIMGYKY